MIGIERNPETLEPRPYYLKVPEVEGAHVFVLEPMLATGGSIATAVEAVQRFTRRTHENDDIFLISFSGRPVLRQDFTNDREKLAQALRHVNATGGTALYDALAQLMPSPVVDLNRAVALGMAFGPAAGLELVDSLTANPALAGYHLLPSVRGDLLAKLGRFEEARAEFARAASLTQNVRERELLKKKGEAL